MKSYTQEQRQRAAELAKQKEEQARIERSKKIRAQLIRNLESKKKNIGLNP